MSEIDDDRAEERAAMVADQLVTRGIVDPLVLAAMGAVRRHLFVPPELRALAYADRPLPIGDGQTISQPYVVAAMTELARVGPGARVLEIGTGSGYQAAVLSELGAEVYSVEIVEALALRVAATLATLGYAVRLQAGDGYAGWPSAAPFAAILVTAAPPTIPHPLLSQLEIGGRMVVPIGPTGGRQDLFVITRVSELEFRRDDAFPVTFVPMTGEAQRTR